MPSGPCLPQHDSSEISSTVSNQHEDHQPHQLQEQQTAEDEELQAAPPRPPADVLASFDSFIFAKTPQGFHRPKPAPQTTPRSSALVFCRSPVSKEGPTHTRKRSAADTGCTDVIPATEQSTSQTNAPSLAPEAELSPGVRVSLEWLAESQRRRGLCSAEVAASFRCPSCGRFEMEFKSGRYGIFLGCSHYPRCNGRISGAKVERWRSCLGDSSTRLRLVFEMEDPASFRLHAGGCTDTGELLREALPRIIAAASRIYAKQQKEQQQEGSDEGDEQIAIPHVLRPLSWIPRSDRIRADASLLLQFCTTAVAHARRTEALPSSTSIAKQEGPRVSGASATPEEEGVPVRTCDFEDGAKRKWEGKEGSLAFVDWTEGALRAPSDGLRYTDGCVFRLSTYPLILQAATATCGWAQFSPIPTLTLQFFRDYWGPGRFIVTSKERALRVAWWLLPWRLRKHLLPFQWEGVVYALQRGGRAIIGDEMGLGKTVQAIACMAVYRQFPCLIVVPASMRLAWADALEEWLPEFSGPPKLRVLFASGDRPAFGDDHHICLSSFEMAARLYDSLKASQYKSVIVDEAHKLRGPAMPRAVTYTPNKTAAADAATAAATFIPRNESRYFAGQQQRAEDVHKKTPKCRQKKRCSPFTSGQDANRKILDLVRCSQHALLLSGTPSVRLPADLFPLVDALLPPLEQQEAETRRAQQLQQWQGLEAAAAAAAAAEGATEKETVVDGPAQSGQAVSCDHWGIVRSPWGLATPAWRAAATAATRHAGSELFGSPWLSAVSSVSPSNKQECFISFAEGGMARRRVGNILREERLQFAEEYCSSSRAFGSWRRFGLSPRSWELHLLLTRAVLIRRRKTLRPLNTEVSSVTSTQPGSEGPEGGPRRTAIRHGCSPAPDMREAPFGRDGEARGDACNLPGRTSTLRGVASVVADAANAGRQAESGMPTALEGDRRGVGNPLGFGDGLVSMKDAETLVKGLPWAADSSRDCDALVLPPCTRIVQLLLLQSNNKLLTAIGEGLLLQRPAFRALLHEAQTAAATERPCGSSSSGEDAIGGSGLCQPADCLDIAADLIRRPPTTSAERTGLSKVLAAAQWLHEKFFKDAGGISWKTQNDDTPTKIIVFAHHRRVLDALVVRLRELRMGRRDSGEKGRHWDGKTYQGFVRIDGSLMEEERRRRRRLFLTDPNCNLALISITASSHGVSHGLLVPWLLRETSRTYRLSAVLVLSPQLDFSGASVCVFLELLPQQHEMLQAESRLHRRGQRQVVTTFFLLSRCSPAAAATQAAWTQKPLLLDNANEEHHKDEGNTDPLVEEEDREVEDPTSLLRCSDRRRRVSAYLLAIQRASLQLGFRAELKQCCMRLQREAETLDEAAWRRLLQQSALVQQTLDGPLSTSQLEADVHQPQQQQQGSLGSAQQAAEEALIPYRAEQQLFQRHEQNQQPEGVGLSDESFHTSSMKQQQCDEEKRAALPSCLSPSSEQRQGPSDALPSLGLPAPFFESFRFRVSRYTQRIHAFDGDTDRPLGISIAPAELEAGTVAGRLIQHQQQQEQHNRPDTAWDHQSTAVQEAARRYWGLFCLLSSFEQRRFREASLTVQQIQVYIHRCHRAPQHLPKRSSFSGSQMELQFTLPVLQQTQSEHTAHAAAEPAPLPPRHTTDPVLLLQSAQQNQRRDLVAEVPSAQRPLEGRFISNSGGHSRCLPQENQSEGNDTLSSRYFATHETAQPPCSDPIALLPSQEGAHQSNSDEPLSTPSDACGTPSFILIPALVQSTRAAAQRPSALSRHMQPFCLKRQMMLCVSCMKPISAASTTRVFLRLGDKEDPTIDSQSHTHSQEAHSVVGSQLAQCTPSGADAQGSGELLTGSASQITSHSSGGNDPHNVSSSGLLQRPADSPQQSPTGRWNITADGPEGCFIRCTEQDLTCSGRCLDAYAARRRRQALRRQVERHDKGVCNACGLDCGEMLVTLKMLHASGEPHWRLEEEIARIAPSEYKVGVYHNCMCTMKTGAYCDFLKQFRPWPSLIRRLASSLTASCAWEADHRKPVKDGGGLATVDTVQTLCRGCHMEKTLEERSQQRKRRIVGVKTPSEP